MKILSIKVMVTVAIVVLLLIVFSLAQEMNRRLQIQREIVRLESEASKLEKNVIEMDNLNQYFGTDDFVELMAREKLNYKAPGEKVVLIPEDRSGRNEEKISEEPKTKSVPRKWWDAFFAKEDF